MANKYHYDVFGIGQRRAMSDQKKSREENIVRGAENTMNLKGSTPKYQVAKTEAFLSKVGSDMSEYHKLANKQRKKK